MIPLPKWIRTFFSFSRFYLCFFFISRLIFFSFFFFKRTFFIYSFFSYVSTYLFLSIVFFCFVPLSIPPSPSFLKSIILLLQSKEAGLSFFGNRALSGGNEEQMRLSKEVTQRFFV